ncbi:9612_t:CDS:2 [Funneliformis caledonium]|uniref:9612_t:CDS:1 n=1 Tax=Funneliformis caledonium TaxID=1117310 RepID=A0A9N9C0U4_9GLOM|nr:9612_t:CDS:2 [Funneliformis caledonium]
MDLNRLAALGCCSWYFNRKAKNTKRDLIIPPNPSSQSDEMTKKELKSRRKQFGICLKCGQTLTDYKYCQSCSSKEFQSKFNEWTSEDLCIDKFIQGSQLKSTNNRSYLLWIPFDDLIDVKYLANGGFASVYSAIWDHFETKDMVDVVLKRLHNGQISNPEFLKEQVSMFLYGSMNNSNIVRCYGFTKHPTEGYMLVLEQAEDGDLRGFLRRQSSTLLWSEKLFILRDISKSLELLHQHEFVHGDLHTGNILKTNNQRRSCRILKNNKKSYNDNLKNIRLSNKSRDILNQFSLANNNTKKIVKRQSKLPLSLTRSSTLLRNNTYYSKSLSDYVTIMGVEKSANAASFAASTSSVNFDTDDEDS